MLTIQVCVGSSCFIRGAYDVVGALQELIRENRLAVDIELKGSFCLEHCSQGVTVTIDDQVFTKVLRDDVADLFNKEIMPRLKGKEGDQCTP